VTLKGAQVKKAATRALDLPDMPDPALPDIQGTHNVVITGVGGTGVVTVGAILAMAAHLDGKGAGMMEMAGLAQKGGAVHIHCRIANRPEDISAVRVAVGEAHCVIGGDLVVTAGSKTLGLMREGQTGAAVNSHEIITGDFTRNTEFRLPTGRVPCAASALRERLLAVRCVGTCPRAAGRFHLFQHDGVWRGMANGADAAAGDAIRQAIR
jgi:indolepyruvate ferredoxin oxidoreductase